MCVHTDEDCLRLFLCQRCRRQVLICSHCDRGQIYCSAQCAEISRREKHRRAEAHYQKTRRGALKHAARQQRYRKRQRQPQIKPGQKKVTDQGPQQPLHQADSSEYHQDETTSRPQPEEVRNDQPGPHRSIAAQLQEQICLRCDFCNREAPLLTRTFPIHRLRRARRAHHHDHQGKST